MKSPKTYFAFIVIVVAVLWLSGGSALAQDTSPHARTILRRMVATYAGLSSYQDSGVVRLVAADPLIASAHQPFRTVAVSSDELVSFKTYYSRPNKFRFEWKNSSEPPSRDAVIWKNGKREYGWMAQPSADSGFKWSRSELWLLLDEAMGSSMGSAFFVPTLLLKNVVVQPFPSMLLGAERVSVIREEPMDGETCYVIKTELSGAPWLLWIGEKSNVLRKTRTLYSKGSFHQPHKRELLVAEEIHREIRINHRIPKEVFEFKPQPQPNDADYKR